MIRVLGAAMITLLITLGALTNRAKPETDEQQDGGGGGEQHEITRVEEGPDQTTSQPASLAFLPSHRSSDEYFTLISIAV